MPATLRRRLVCFYCGVRSSTVQDGTIRKWTCSNCDADNHLDENGEITDYVPEAPREAVQFAQSFDRSSRASPPAEIIFCESCLKNQHIVNQALAAYLPAADDPNYDDYVESYPAYRDSLEMRYPQVCEVCAPKVEERLRRSSYAAKTDHLRRIMERSKGNSGVRPGGFDPMGPVTRIGGVLWWLAVVLELVWHTGALLDLANLDSVLGSLDYNQATLARQLAFSLHAYLHPWLDTTANLSVLFAGCSVWWHPLLTNKRSNPGLKLRRVGDHYRLAGVVMLERLFGWWILEYQGVVLSHQAQKGLHSFMVVFSLIATPALWQMIKIDFLPRGIFSDSSRTPLGRGVRGVPAPAKTSSSLSASFPVSKLATIAPKKVDRPIDFGDTTDEDEMDWAPIQPGLQPTVRHVSPVKPVGPKESPFTSSLPAAPRSLNARLRNPNEPPRFVKTSKETQQNFFRNSVGLSGSTNGGHAPANSIAPQKLFTPYDQQETGLEDIFGTAFSLKDDPLERLRVQKQRRASAQIDHGTRLRRLLTTSLALILWTIAIQLGNASGVVHFVLMNAVIAEQTLRSDRFSLSMTSPTAVLHAIESLASVATMAYCALALINGNLESPVRELSGAICLAELFVHDFWSFITTSNSARGPVRRVSRTSSNTRPSRQSSKGGMQAAKPLYQATALDRTPPSPEGSDSESITFQSSKRKSPAAAAAPTPAKTPSAPLVRYERAPESVVPSSRLMGLSLGDSPVKQRSSQGGVLDAWGL